MARRRGKGGSKQDDALVLLEPPVGQSRGINEYILPSALFLIILIGASTLCWFCSQQQQAIDELSESLATTRTRVTTLQQQLGTGNAQLASVGGFEERLLALEEAFAKAQRQAEVALAASEQIQSKDLQSKIWALQTEMTSRLSELQQNTIAIASLNGVIKNKSDEVEAVKQSVGTILSANSELAVSISGLATTLSVTEVRLDEHISVVDGLMSQLESQKKEIAEMKESFASSQEVLATNAQKFKDIQDLLDLDQGEKTQADRSLEDRETSVDSVHFPITAQIEALRSQVFLREDLLAEEQEDTTDSKEQAPIEELTEEQGVTEGQGVMKEEVETPAEQETREEEMVPEEHGLQKEKEMTEEQEEEIPQEHGAVEETAITEQDGAQEEEDATEEQGITEDKEETEEQGVTVEDELTGEQEARVTEEFTKAPEAEAIEELGVKADELTEEPRAGSEEVEISEQDVKEHADAEESDTSTNQTMEPDVVETERDEQMEEEVEDEIQNPDTTMEEPVKEEQMEMPVAEEFDAPPVEGSEEEESQTFSHDEQEKIETDEQELQTNADEAEESVEGISEEQNEDHSQTTIKHEPVEEQNEESAKEQIVEEVENVSKDPVRQTVESLGE